MDLAEVLSNNTYLFILIMVRYTGLFLITPVLGSRVVPRRVKIGIAFLLAVITFPILQQTQQSAFPAHVLQMIIDIFREISIGLFMGMITYFIFVAFQLAGQFIDLRMGFRMANVVDPMSGASSPLVGQLQNILATLVFLSINGHHILIRALYKSFSTIPLGGVQFSNQLWGLLIRKSADIFIIGFRVALPIFGTIFIADIIFAFLARAVPQMNIFIIGFPVKIFIGILFMFLSIHIIIHYFDSTFTEMFKDILKMLKLLAP